LFLVLLENVSKADVIGLTEAFVLVPLLLFVLLDDDAKACVVELTGALTGRMSVCSVTLAADPEPSYLKSTRFQAIELLRTGCSSAAGWRTDDSPRISVLTVEATELWRSFDALSGAKSRRPWVTIGGVGGTPRRGILRFDQQRDDTLKERV
jgi:predicted small integral membrane protein